MPGCSPPGPGAGGSGRRPRFVAAFGLPAGAEVEFAPLAAVEVAAADPAPVVVVDVGGVGGSDGGGDGGGDGNGEDGRDSDGDDVGGCIGDAGGSDNSDWWCLVPLFLRLLFFFATPLPPARPPLTFPLPSVPPAARPVAAALPVAPAVAVAALGAPPLPFDLFVFDGICSLRGLPPRAVRLG